MHEKGKDCGQEVFDFTQTREYDDVVAEAKKKGERIRMAHVHGLIYEKEDDPARKFKGRGVLPRSHFGSSTAPLLGGLFHLLASWGGDRGLT